MNYSFQSYDAESMARALGVGLAISHKQSIEICNFIRGMPVAKAKLQLQRILEMKNALPLRRFIKDRGHKPGIGPGAYPQRATKEFLKLLADVEANAVQKGLAVDKLQIIHVAAQFGGNMFHYGRQRRRRMKRTHVEVVVKEAEKAAAKKQKAEGKQ